MTNTKSSVLGGALKNISRPNVEQKTSVETRTEQVLVEPTEPAKISQTPKSEKRTQPIGVLFRLDAVDHEIVSDYARDKGWSMQELLEHAVNVMRRSEGLSEIKGRPRGKKAGSSSK